MITEKKVEAIRSMVQRSATEPMFDCRYAIYRRILKYITEASDDAELYAWLLKDFPAWTACFLVNVANDPIVLSPWQVQANDLSEIVERILMFTVRKVGKTTFAAAKTLHRAAIKDHARKVIFAPTHGQDFIFKMIRKQAKQPFIKDAYFGSGDAMDTGTVVRLSNGSEILSHSIGLGREGEFNLGEMGDGVVIDEIQQLPKHIWVSIINPYLWDIFSEKDFVGTGTPSLKWNPELDVIWDEWNRCEHCGRVYEPKDAVCQTCGETRALATFTIDWERGVREGILRERNVRRDMKKMTPDEIDMYLNAKFPPRSGRFYDRSILLACKTPGIRFLSGSSVYAAGEEDLPMPAAGADYVMAVDHAKEQDRTEILVGEIVRGHLFYRYWKRIHATGVAYTQQIGFEKRLFKQLRARSIIPDTTSQQDVFIEMLTQEPDAIPQARIWQDPAKRPEDKARYGFKASDIANDFMHKNHKVALINGLVHVPAQEPFLSEWVTQHNQLKARTTKNNLTILDAPKNGYKDLAVVSAMLSLFIKARQRTKALMDVRPW